jgi:hypothetical protein
MIIDDYDLESEANSDFVTFDKFWKPYSASFRYRDALGKLIPDDQVQASRRLANAVMTVDPPESFASFESHLIKTGLLTRGVTRMRWSSEDWERLVDSVLSTARVVGLGALLAHRLIWA